MKKIVELANNRGFVFAGSQIYGGFANTWDYGPYGSLLKENIKNLWIRDFVQKRTDVVYIDSAIFTSPKVWEASGHVSNFNDPLMDCKECKNRWRADKLIEENYFKLGIDEVADGMTNEDMEKYIKENEIKCPNCSACNFTSIRQFNLLFKTHQGVLEDSKSSFYLRGETAQGIFVNFANVLRTSRRKIPFGVAQVGKAFRNEITPGNFIFRTREFEQMELEFFCEPGSHVEWLDHWKEFCMNYLVTTLGIDRKNLRFRQHDKDELSFYSNDTWDIEYKFPFGWGEIWGIASRTDYDLKTHMTHSKENLSYFDPVDSKKYIPYVVEPAAGLSRFVLSALVDAYTEEEDRTYLKFHPSIAPIKVGIMPIVKKLGDKAKDVYSILSDKYVCEYDEVGSVGKRYARFDEIGTPFCVTIDNDTIDNDTVTVRYRDSKEQVSVSIGNLVDFIGKELNI